MMLSPGEIEELLKEHAHRTGARCDPDAELFQRSEMGSDSTPTSSRTIGLSSTPPVESRSSPFATNTLTIACSLLVGVIVGAFGVGLPWLHQRGQIAELKKKLTSDQRAASVADTEEAILRQRFDTRHDFQVTPVAYLAESDSPRIREYRMSKEVDLRLPPDMFSHRFKEQVFTQVQVCWDYDPSLVRASKLGLREHDNNEWSNVYSIRSREKREFDPVVRHTYEHDANMPPKNRLAVIRYWVTNDPSIRKSLGISAEQAYYDESFQLETSHDGIAIIGADMSGFRLAQSDFRAEVKTNGSLLVDVNIPKRAGLPESAATLHLFVREADNEGREYKLASKRFSVAELRRSQEKARFELDLKKRFAPTDDQLKEYELLVVAVPMPLGNSELPGLGANFEDGILATHTVTWNQSRVN